ncbi:cupin domain-containing protein [Erythrobacter alti]|uniref:cupin domain-containing protein n=1 Tax=Erythrobacter alti TaxID=1896145 RepID=UPI0030F3B17B
MPTAALEQLIAPLTPEEFFGRYYERQFYRSPVKHPEIEGLLSLDRIDEIISDSELPASAINLAKSGQGIPQDEYVFANNVVDRGAVLDNYRNGATIILPQLHFADGKLYSFCLGLERAFGARIQTNVYLTPPDAHGFGVHYDNHDVFVIQIAGAKEWEIYGDRDGLPFRGEGFRKGVDETGELKEKFVLEAGECLYVPRGTAHRAPNHGDEPSLHITVGILVQTWAEFMLEAVAEASLRIPAMRNSLPRNLFFERESALADHAEMFRHLSKEIASKADFEATLNVFSGNFVRAQGPRLRGALLALADGIRADDNLRVRDHILYSFETTPTPDGEGQELQIVLAGASIPLSDELGAQLQERLLASTLAKNEFTVSDVEELDDVIGTLVAYGLLIRE